MRPNIIEKIKFETKQKFWSKAKIFFFGGGGNFGAKIAAKHNSVARPGQWGQSNIGQVLVCPPENPQYASFK